MKPITYIDMDNVLVDFKSGIARLDDKTREQYRGDLDEVPGIFSLMDPMPGAINAVHELKEHYDLYVLSTAPWLNPSAWTDKLHWIQKYFGKEKDSVFYKRLIISHRKHLNHGDYLIDDRPNNGAEDFAGEWIRFGQEPFVGWDEVAGYLINRKM